MARTGFTTSALTANGGVALSGTAIDQTNGMSLTDFGNKRADKMILLVTNSAAASHNVTVRAGTYPLNNPSGPAFRSFLGDLVVPVTNGTTQAIVVESARFEQSDRGLYLDFDSGFTGTVQALTIPLGY